jgi:hypothetical protein
VKVRFDWNVVYKDAQEPVQGKEGGVDAVLGKVSAQTGQLLLNELF